MSPMKTPFQTLGLAVLAVLVLSPAARSKGNEMFGTEETRPILQGAADLRAKKEMDRLLADVDRAPELYAAMARERGTLLRPASTTVSRLVKAPYRHECHDCHGYEPAVVREETFLLVSIRTCAEESCLHSLSVKMLPGAPLPFEELSADFVVTDADAALLSGPRTRVKLDLHRVVDLRVDGERRNLEGDGLMRVLRTIESARQTREELEKVDSQKRGIDERVEGLRQDLLPGK